MIFQSTLPVGEATLMLFRTLKMAFYFNPRFPWGKRLEALDFSAAMAEFQSTLPVGEATTKYFSYSLSKKISIHASRGGSDVPVHNKTFLAHNFNPRFPWGKRLILSICARLVTIFQSTLPVGEATRFECKFRCSSNISIHASRGGSDSAGASGTSASVNFNPRFPWGKRLALFAETTKAYFDFNPRFPWGKRRSLAYGRLNPPDISIHASRGGSDQLLFQVPVCSFKFQSTLPVGEATRAVRPFCSWGYHFNPRFPWGKRHPSISFL